MGFVLWFVLTALSVAFVAVDIWRAPVHPVMKWAFVILAVFTGPFAAFFYVLGCREPFKGTHALYVAARWRQVLGSTMHCAAGDGIGIIAGATIVAYQHPPAWVDFPLEYLLGFGFGWTFFQAFAMRDMAGGSYLRSLRQTFLPEFLSMNVLMAGMVPTMAIVRPYVVGGTDPLSGGFWFVMSAASHRGVRLRVSGQLVARGAGPQARHDHLASSGGDDASRRRVGHGRFGIHRRQGGHGVVHDRLLGRECRTHSPAGWVSRLRQARRHASGCGRTCATPNRRIEQNARQQTAGERRERACSGATR